MTITVISSTEHLTDAVTRVTLWRCGGCGKWSHAKRRPSSHVRFIPTFVKAEWELPGARQERAELPAGRQHWEAEDEAVALGLPILEHVEPTNGTTTAWNDRGDPEPDDWYDPGGVRVKCGPFLEYEARLVQR